MTDIMAFDVEKLFEFCLAELEQFASKHTDEVFYAFAIDASLLCLNSVHHAQETLRELQDRWERNNRFISSWDEMSPEDIDNVDFLLGLHERRRGLDRSDKAACLDVINDSRKKSREDGNPYLKPSEIAELRANTGDWAYQGFAEMGEEDGSDEDAYAEHYDMTDEEQTQSEYAKAMDEIVKRLHAANAFSKLKVTDDFHATRVEHNY